MYQHVGLVPLRTLRKLGAIDYFFCLFFFSLSCSVLFRCEQPRSQPAASEEVGVLLGGGAEGPSRTRPVPEVSGVRVQLREFTVRLPFNSLTFFFLQCIYVYVFIMMFS